MKIRGSFKMYAPSRVQILADTDPEFSDPVVTDFFTPSDFNIVKWEVDGLDPDTVYHLTTRDSFGNLGGRSISCRTAQTGVHSFSFASASCADNLSEAPVFDSLSDKVDANDIQFFVHLGDLHYYDIGVNDEKLFHDAFDTVFLWSEKQSALWSKLPMFYMWDDHDYGPSLGGDKESPSRPAAIAAFRRRVPVPFASANPSDGVYYSFVRGRCRFVVTDTRSERTPQTALDTNDPNKRIWSPEQRDWFFAELLEAKAQDQAVFWVNTYPFISGSSAHVDHWGGYNFARQEVLTFLSANDLNDRIAIVAGDMHALAYDDGTSTNNPGNLHVCHAAPLDRTRSEKGGPYLVGPIHNDSSVHHTRQYGLFDVTDTGGEFIDVRFRGIAVENNGDESEVLDESFQLRAEEAA